MSQSVYEKQHGQTYVVEGPKLLSASILLTIEVSDYFEQRFNSVKTFFAGDSLTIPGTTIKFESAEIRKPELLWC